MKKIYMLSLLLLLLFSIPLLAQETVGNAADVAAVKKTIVDAYVKGMFLEGSAEAVKKGWHPDCEIVIYQNGTLKKLPISYWIKRFTDRPGPLDPKAKHRFLHVHVKDYAAIATVEIKSGDKPVYIDFMNLYKFEDGWKICTKTFYAFPR